jgi:hypothetical protein
VLHAHIFCTLCVFGLLCYFKDLVYNAIRYTKMGDGEGNDGEGVNIMVAAGGIYLHV